MKKFNKILIFGITTIIVIAVAVVFAIDWKDTEVEKTNQKDTEDVIMDSKSFRDQTLSTKEIRDRVPSRSISESGLQSWNSYMSEILEISFKYPPQYLVVEVKETSTTNIGSSVFLKILEYTPYNRHHAKILNPDFDYDIPEDRKNADIEPSQGISFSKSIEGDFTQDVVEWYRGNKSGKNANLDVHTSADFLGIDSVAYQAEGLFTFDGVIFEKDGHLYQFIVQYFTSPESPKDNFYKIISTVEFQ